MWDGGERIKLGNIAVHDDEGWDPPVIYMLGSHDIFRFLQQLFRGSGSGKIMRRSGKQHLSRKKNVKRRLRLSKMAEVFLAITVPIQFKDVGLRRMVNLMMKELSPSADEDMIEALMGHYTQIKGYLKRAIVDKNMVVATAALSAIHLLLVCETVLE
ncbi:OLC1v1032566C1 [Oldenlandia corymbosa var. corymbosa]|uniref:OLC1v1032566C1 n=1 Tax=Oldenlandia corymbosa var. corymbosa TaxID=529605 RepID=A0AAV1CLA4_OLDCO|nr:OLC1v1032566C1 [Oldenlandia corymbosa var. corymbosa]